MGQFTTDDMILLESLIASNFEDSDASADNADMYDTDDVDAAGGGPRSGPTAHRPPTESYLRFVVSPKARTHTQNTCAFRALPALLVQTFS